MSDYPPSPLDLSVSQNICSDTVKGWLWYCDEHDTHGNADSQAEAQHTADAHSAFFLADDEDAEGPCQVIVWLRSPDEQAPDE